MPVESGASFFLLFQAGTAICSETAKDSAAKMTGMCSRDD
jgi:hypothetical protein